MAIPYKSVGLVPKPVKGFFPNDIMKKYAEEGRTTVKPLNLLGTPTVTDQSIPMPSPYVPSTPRLLPRQEKEGHDKNKLIGNPKLQETAPTPLPNVRPLVDIVNYLSANASINKIRKTELGRKNLYYNTPSLSVRPIQDLSPEILAAQADAVTQNRSDYAGSDPVMNLLSKNIAAAGRGKMRSEQIVGRAANLVQERGRFDTETRANQQAAADTANKNLEREQDFQDYKIGVNTATLEAKKDLNAKALSAIGAHMDTAAQYNLTVSTEERANARQLYNDELKIAQMEPNEGLRRGLIKSAQDKFAISSAAQPITNYRDAQKLALKGILPKRWQNLGVKTEPTLTPGS